MPRRHDTRRAGFTLVETLLAALLGALLLAAAASSAGQFSQAMAELQQGTADTYENVLARLGRDVRYAWWVDVPARNRLQVVGSDNLVTEYIVVGNSLLVTRPDGSSGSVVTGLASLTFAADDVQRLREGTSRAVDAAMASRSLPALAVPLATAISSSQAYAISFVTPSDAGERGVAGVSEQYRAWRPSTLDLAMARVGASTLTFTLYPAFGPGRAEPRPGAAAIASWTQDLAGLPAAVVVAAPPLVPRTPYALPASSTSFNVPVLPSNLEPGVAYTLVMTVSAGCTAVFTTATVGAHTEQMVRTAAGAWQAVPVVAPFALRGSASCTSTRATPVASQVRIALQSEAGASYVGSAAVYGQVLADDPWLGVVPGELPADH
jgi:type II secretory pathway pseudopilin PulG